MENWTEKDNKLRKTFEFKDFVSAFGFMSKVAIEAEKMNHHPNWFNSWNKVEFELNTHSAGGKVTEKDYILAETIDRLATEAKVKVM